MAKQSTLLNTHLRDGLAGISHMQKQDAHEPRLVKQRMIYVTSDVIASHLSTLFTRFKGLRLIRRICRPSEEESQALQSPQLNQATLALAWCQELDIDPTIRQNALPLLQEIAELHVQQQIQSKLLISA